MFWNAGASVNIQDEEGRTAQNWAEERGNLEAAEALEAAGQRGAA